MKSKLDLKKSIKLCLKSNGSNFIMISNSKTKQSDCMFHISFFTVLQYINNLFISVYFLYLYSDFYFRKNIWDNVEPQMKHKWTPFCLLGYESATTEQCNFPLADKHLLAFWNVAKLLKKKSAYGCLIHRVTDRFVKAWREKQFSTSSNISITYWKQFQLYFLRHWLSTSTLPRRLQDYISYLNVLI